MEIFTETNDFFKLIDLEKVRPDHLGFRQPAGLGRGRPGTWALSRGPLSTPFTARTKEACRVAEREGSPRGTSVAPRWLSRLSSGVLTDRSLVTATLVSTGQSSRTTWYTRRRLALASTSGRTRPSVRFSSRRISTRPTGARASCARRSRSSQRRSRQQRPRARAG